MTRALTAQEGQLLEGLFDPGFMQTGLPGLGGGAAVLPTVDTLRQAVAEGDPVGTYYAPAFGAVLPNLAVANAVFGGASQPFGALSAPGATDGGDDRVFDHGGANAIYDGGGRNNILTGDGDDVIKTGPGDDLVNARDGDNRIVAGAGDNFVRGGAGRDEVTVGTGDDTVELFAGSLLLDADGDPVEDPKNPGTFLENLTAPIDLALHQVPLLFEASNAVLDEGGADTLRATASSREDDPDFIDTEFNGADLAISDISVLEAARGLVAEGVPGDGRIELGGGQTLVIDDAGDNIVQALGGDDFVFTSLVVPGADEIATGGGADQIDPGGGADRVRAGPGDDRVTLTEPGGAAPDTLVYGPGDVLRQPALAPEAGPGETLAEVQALTFFADTIIGFEAEGAAADGFELNDLGVAEDDLHLFDPALLGLPFGDPAVPDTAVFLDADGSGFDPDAPTLGAFLDNFTEGDLVLGVLDGAPAGLPTAENLDIGETMA